MPQYMLILRGDVTKELEISPAAMQDIIERYGAWAASLAKEGRLNLGRKLTEQGGKVMDPSSGSVKVKDGPYVETKEVVGGVYVIKADSYDHAVKLCKEHPNLQFGSIEIREIDWMGQPEEG